MRRKKEERGGEEVRKAEANVNVKNDLASRLRKNGGTQVKYARLPQPGKERTRGRDSDQVCSTSQLEKEAWKIKFCAA